MALGTRHPGLVEDGLTAAGTPDWLNSLILDGIIGGVGAVLGFVPQMLSYSSSFPF
jgi:ferrous iron transport protein B